MMELAPVYSLAAQRDFNHLVTKMFDGDRVMTTNDVAKLASWLIRVSENEGMGMKPVTYEKFNLPSGVYTREMQVEANQLFIGAQHTTKHLCKLIEGEMIIWTANKGVKLYQAGDTFWSYPGDQRVGYSLTKCAFATYHDNISMDMTPEERFAALTHKPFQGVLQ